jgi:hypothetical protein
MVASNMILPRENHFSQKLPFQSGFFNNFPIDKQQLFDLKTRLTNAELKD